jgi:endonuclease YncB( thermonuclease family)
MTLKTSRSTATPARCNRLFPIALLVAPLPTLAYAQDVSGPARVTDGDTLNLTGFIIRLHGIDAPELKQSCTRDGAPWACGKEAADRLSGLVQGQIVRCEQQDIDDYGRTVAACKVGQTDLSAAMADAGLAVALPKFTTAYVPNEARARDQRRGIWGAEFQMPADYRAANPSPRQNIAPPNEQFEPPTRPSASGS